MKLLKVMFCGLIFSRVV